MSKSFDPYLEWLKIPADRRPPTYYALLGVEDFEEDLDKIEESFQELYSKVRRYQVGEHGADAIRLLTEMSRAYDCLTSPHHKKKYDRELRGGDVGDSALADPTPVAPAKKKRKGKPAKVELIDDDDEQPLTAPAAPNLTASSAAGLTVVGSANPKLPTAALSGAVPSAATSSKATASSAAPAGSYDAVWYIQTPDGRRLGPATQAQLDEVVAHRRVNPRSMVWRVGWPEATPVAQMFPELKPAAGAGAFGPYQKLQVRPEVEQSRKGIFFVVLLLGAIAAVLALYYGFAFTFNFMLMGLIGLIGAAALAAGLMEVRPLLNSPPLSAYRQRIGDEATRKLCARVGGMCVLVSLMMIGWQAAGYIRSGVSGLSRNLARVPVAPNLNVDPGSTRPAGFGPNRTGPNRAGPVRPGNRGGGGTETPVTGPQPRIRSFSTYQFGEGETITISGNGFSGTQKVIFAKPGNAKSRSSALESRFKIVNDSTLEVTVPLQMRFGKAWVCEVHSNGGIAISIPPDTRAVDGHAQPNAVVQLTPGAKVTSLNNCIAILEGDNEFTVMLFTRAYVLGRVNLQRGCNANVLIGRGSNISQASPSNSKIMVAGGVSVFRQPQAFQIR